MRVSLSNTGGGVVERGGSHVGTALSAVSSVFFCNTCVIAPRSAPAEVFGQKNQAEENAALASKPRGAAKCLPRCKKTQKKKKKIRKN